jgi:hypothetical protein
MTYMKLHLKLHHTLAASVAALALSPALLKADPNPSPPVSLAVTNAPTLQEDLADQAALVQQIGSEAARGFDPEAHARALRAQIEALIAGSATAKAAPEAPPLAPEITVRTAAANSSMPAAVGVSAPGTSEETAVREAIQKLRAVLDRLEAQLNTGAHQHP